MPRKNRFQPALDGALESRVVLNGAGSAQVSAVFGRRVPRGAIGSDGRGLQRRDSAAGRISDAIDRAYDSFTVDYLEAQAAYLSAKATTADEIKAAKEVMKDATELRVSLLSQQLIQIFGRVPGSLKRPKGAPETPVQSFLRRRITSNTPDSGSLRQDLLKKSIPATPGVSDSTATLYTLAATNAIESARVATVNATKFLATGVFQNRH